MRLGDPIELAYFKYPSRPHWCLSGYYLGMDCFGHWLTAPAGTRMSRPGVDVDLTYDATLLIPSAGAYTAMFSASRPTAEVPNPVVVYVDITDTPAWSGCRVTAVDLDLDVVRFHDGTVRVEDEDEFETHQQQLGYPRHVVQAALDTCQQVKTTLALGQEPYGKTATRWFAEAEGLRQG